MADQTLVWKATNKMREAAALLEDFADSEDSDDALFELYCRSTAERLRRRADKILPPAIKEAKIMEMRKAK